MESKQNLSLHSVDMTKPWLSLLSTIKKNITEFDGMYGNFLTMHQVFISDIFCCQYIGGKSLTLIEEIGRGSYGLVHKAVWRGTIVAAKVINISSSTQSALNEFKVLRYSLAVILSLIISGQCNLIIYFMHYLVVYTIQILCQLWDLLNQRAQ